MKKKDLGLILHGNKDQGKRRDELVKLLKDCPIPDQEILLNMGLFLVPQTLSRILFMDFLYRKIMEVQGVVFDFGCRWGQNLSLFTSFRGIYEPFNRLRKIVGFDTFSGFPEIVGKDGESKMMYKKSYGVTPHYEDYLAKIIGIQEQESPVAHIKKYELVKGDASAEIKKYLKQNPQTIVAMAYFDFDLYEPTKECLLAIQDRLTRGSVLGFDELNDHLCPGETLALKEVLGLRNCAIRRFPYNSRASYMVVE